LPIGAAIHMFFAIYVYTSREIYPLAVKEEDYIFRDYMVDTFEAMMSKYELIFLILSLSIIGCVILHIFIRRALFYFCKGFTASKWENMKDVPNTYTDVKDWIRVNNIVSYNILANPDYNYIIEQGQRAISK
jgi:hypothetical protein